MSIDISINELKKIYDNEYEIEPLGSCYVFIPKHPEYKSFNRHNGITDVFYAFDKNTDEFVGYFANKKDYNAFKNGDEITLGR